MGVFQKGVRDADGHRAQSNGHQSDNSQDQIERGPMRFPPADRLQGPAGTGLRTK